MSVKIILFFGESLKFVLSVKTLRRCIYFFLIIILAPKTNAQNLLTNLRTRSIFSSKTLSLCDTLSIVPNSVTIENSDASSKIFFQIDNSCIVFDSTNLAQAHFPLKITYRVFDFNFEKKVFKREMPNFQRVAPAQSISQPLLLAEGLKSIFDKELEYSGNYTQGFSTGNTQNVTVNQNFNLNVAGKLGDVEILAAMSDNNVPIQAQGNTLQLRELERIFIQLKKDNLSLLAGDYELYRPSSYFLNYQKKLQGATFSGVFDLPKLKNSNANASENKNLAKIFIPTLKLKTSLAISKGKFARNVLAVQEGNQGPYRLTGNAASNYFIILSGTEKVFFDGRPLLRGEENDYVIDYNAGTIQFMPRTLVTREARIVVEFEYSDQNYLRSIAAVTSEIQLKTTKISVNFYSEQDSKNSSGVQSLDSLDKQILFASRNASDIITPSSIRTANGFSTDRTQYAQIDTTVNGKIYSGVLVFSTDAARAQYTASFSPVDLGSGDYVLDAQNYVNGRVYKWIAPNALGVRQGNFAPVKRLIPPNQQQIASVGIEQKLGKHLILSGESAVSRYNPNLFSSNTDAVLARGAFQSQLAGNWYLDTPKTLKLISQTQFEYVQSGFRPLNPYRASEFSRDWNTSSAVVGNTTSVSVGSLDPSVFKTAENWLTQTITLEKNNLGALQYGFSTYKRDSLYSGVRQNINLHLQKKLFAFDARVNDLKTTSSLEKTNFTRPETTLSFFLKDYKLGFNSQAEINSRRDLNFDTLTRNAYYFIQNQFFFEKSGKNNWRLEYSKREEYSATNNSFGLNNSTESFKLNGSTSTTASQILAYNLTYRSLTNGFNADITPQKTYLGRVEYSGNFAQRFFTTNTLYEIGSAREQKLEYQFIKVNKGEGQYIWRRNGTDSIPKLSEFELTPYLDQGEYVRVALFSNQFQNTYNTTLTQGFTFDPSRWRKSVQPIKKIISHVSALSNISVARRVSQSVGIDAVFNPFQNALADTVLIGLNTTSRHSLFINRNGSVWELELSKNASLQRATYITGFEQRDKNEYLSRLRYNFTNTTTAQFFVSNFQQNSNTENFTNRNYQITGFKIEPQLTVFLSKNARITTQYRFKSAQNNLKSAGEKIILNEISTEFTLNATKAAQLRAKISGTVVSFLNGDANSATGFTLLEGLQNGNNFIWNASYEKVLSQNLLLSLNYEGRNLGSSPVSHVGRMQIRANF